MNSNLSRRALATYAVDELSAKTPASKLAKKLAAAMVAAGKAKDWELLLSDIAEELENRKLLTQATVTSANALSTELKQKLEGFIKEMTRTEQVLVATHIDKDVIGGFRIDTAKRSFDKTIARELAEIKGGI